jgi:hypothetical protein
MADYLPERFNQQGSSLRAPLRDVLAVRRANSDVFHNGVRAAVVAANFQTNSIAGADATQFCLGTELDVLADGKARAGDDPDAQVLVWRKVKGLSDRNERRLDRTYG